MKKFILGALVAVPLAITALLPASADAAMSSWKPAYGKPGCSVRVWTDSIVYKKGADTVDWYAESKGNCGKLEFRAGLYTVPSTRPSDVIQTGWFNFRTPTKSININNNLWRDPGYMALPAEIHVELYQNGKMVGVAQSKELLIHPQ